MSAAPFAIQSAPRALVHRGAFRIAFGSACLVAASVVALPLLAAFPLAAFGTYLVTRRVKTFHVRVFWMTACTVIFMQSPNVTEHREFTPLRVAFAVEPTATAARVAELVQHDSAAHMLHLRPRTVRDLFFAALVLPRGPAFSVPVSSNELVWSSDARYVAVLAPAQETASVLACTTDGRAVVTIVNAASGQIVHGRFDFSKEGRHEYFSRFTQTRWEEGVVLKEAGQAIWTRYVSSCLPRI